ncbi:MAG TPA: hypothetical protein VFV31_16010, partial [Chitinophagaceae bacterium]|nr:hypothetical protein [Chitinophagaceae bacterium]
GTVNVGTLQACGTSSAQFIELMIDGTPYNYVSPPDNFNYSDSTITGLYTNKTWIFAFRQNTGTTSYSSFSFSNNTAVANGLPLNILNVSLGAGLSSQIITTANPVVNVTTFGPTGTGFVEGNFNVQMDFAGTIRNVVCNFRVRRM